MSDKKQDWIFVPKNVGERLPRIVLQDERFKSFDLNHLIGKPVVLFYFLNIHHPFYTKGKLAWQYNPTDMMVLCHDCHKKIHNIE